MSQVNVLVAWRSEDKHLDAIRAVSHRVNVMQATEQEDRLHLAPQAEVWFGWGFNREVFDLAQRLRWIQITSAGVDRLLFDELRQSDIVVTNASGVYGVPIAEQGLGQISDAREIDKVTSEVIAANPQAVADYKAGKAQSLKFLVGQVMGATRGRANPGLAGELLKKKLEEG